MDIHTLKPILDRLVQADDKWNFDLEDCDHILRIETWSVSASTIIVELEKAGYRCEELEDILSSPMANRYSIDFDNSIMGKAICGF